MRTAVYPGSFDPVTLGHYDIIERTAKMVDKLIIGVLNNKAKCPLFSAQERVNMLKEVTSSLPNVEIQSFEGLLIDFVQPGEFYYKIQRNFIRVQYLQLSGKAGQRQGDSGYPSSGHRGTQKRYHGGDEWESEIPVGFPSGRSAGGLLSAYGCPAHSASAGSGSHHHHALLYVLPAFAVRHIHSRAAGGKAVHEGGCAPEGVPGEAV